MRLEQASITVLPDNCRSAIRQRPNIKSARASDMLRARLFKALRDSARYEVRRNVMVPLSKASLRLVTLSKGSYLGVSLPFDSQSSCNVSFDLLVIDREERWAGGFVVCNPDTRSQRAMRCLERTLRAAELVLRAYVRQHGIGYVDTVVVGIVHGSEWTSDSDMMFAEWEFDNLMDLNRRPALPEHRSSKQNGKA